MARHKLVILSNPTEGMEEEYRKWYLDQHLADVIKTPGFISAELLSIVPPPLDVEGLAAEKLSHKYVAIYEIETDDLMKTWHDLHERIGGPEMYISPALNSDVQPMLATPLRDVLRK